LAVRRPGYAEGVLSVQTTQWDMSDLRVAAFSGHDVPRRHVAAPLNRDMSEPDAGGLLSHAVPEAGELPIPGHVQELEPRCNGGRSRATEVGRTLTIAEALDLTRDTVSAITDSRCQRRERPGT
jgi:hypothetical protein